MPGLDANILWYKLGYASVGSQLGLQKDSSQRVMRLQSPLRTPSFPLPHPASFSLGISGDAMGHCLKVLSWRVLAANT